MTAAGGSARQDSTRFSRRDLPESASTRQGQRAPRQHREALANQWWSQRFTAVLEGYGLGPRLERGRRYARGGRVKDLIVKAGRLEARVQGSRATPYRVSVRSEAASKAQWRSLELLFASRLGWAAQLLAGEVPANLEAAFAEAGAALFPRRWADLQVRCGCPDDAEPCKHIAAVLYVFAQQLDGDPWLLLAWHGRDRQTLLQALQQGPQRAAASGAKAAGQQVRGKRAGGKGAGEKSVGGAQDGADGAPLSEAEGLPPWWPAGLRSRPDPRLQPPDHLPPDPPERALQRLGPLELPGAPPDWQERLAEMYRKLVAEE
jgi:uncharacterized Zn finger protein